MSFSSGCFYSGRLFINLAIWPRWFVSPSQNWNHFQKEFIDWLDQFSPGSMGFVFLFRGRGFAFVVTFKGFLLIFLNAVFDYFGDKVQGHGLVQRELDGTFSLLVGA